MNIVNSDNEWGKLKEIMWAEFNNYLIPVTKNPFTRDDLKLIKKSRKRYFQKNVKSISKRT